MSLVRNLHYVTLPVYQKLLGKLEHAGKTGRLNDFTNFEVALARVKNARDSIPEDERGPIERFLEGEGYPSAIVSGDYLKELYDVVFQANFFLNNYRKDMKLGESFPDSMVGSDDDIFDYEIALGEICQRGMREFREYIYGMTESEKTILDYRPTPQEKETLTKRFWMATENAYRESRAEN